MLTEGLDHIIDKVYADGSLHILEYTVIYKDGIEYMRSKNARKRKINPGEDINQEQEHVFNVAKALHTAPVIIAYFDKMKEGTTSEPTLAEIERDKQAALARL